MVELSGDKLSRIERGIVWPCEQALEKNGWVVTWFPADSDRMLVEKCSPVLLNAKEQDEELSLVRDYLIDVFGMSAESLESAITPYKEKVEGDLPYVFGLEVLIDGHALIEKYVREQPVSEWREGNVKTLTNEKAGES